MKLTDIKHKGTRNCIAHLNIDIEPFTSIDELKAYINKNRQKLYRQAHPEYFKTYMRERYREIKGITGKKHPLRQNDATVSV